MDYEREKFTNTRSIVVGALVLLVIVASFWLSFSLGKKVFVPIKPSKEEEKNLTLNLTTQTPEELTLAGEEITSQAAPVKEAEPAVKMPEVEVKVIPFAGTKKEKILEKKPQPHPAAVSKTVTVARVKQTTPVKKTTRAVVQLAEKGRVFYYKVLAGSFAKEINARELALRLKEKGFSVFVDRVTVGGQKFFRVQTGAFNQKQEAQNLLGSLKASGFEGAIVIE